MTEEQYMNCYYGGGVDADAAANANSGAGNDDQGSSGNGQSWVTTFNNLGGIRALLDIAATTADIVREGQSPDYKGNPNNGGTPPGSSRSEEREKKAKTNTLYYTIGAGLFVLVVVLILVLRK